ncbi:hypothetical protein [Streptomyces sp. NPDC054849]
MPTPARRRLIAAVATDTEIDQLIRARQASGEAGDSGEDLLGRLLAARDEEGRPLTAAEVRDEAAIRCSTNLARQRPTAWGVEPS